MRKSKIIAVVLATALALPPAVSYGGLAPAAPAPSSGVKFGTGGTGWVWGIFGCAGGIIFTAMVANWTQRRQLTLPEAATCGILFWFNPALRYYPWNPVIPGNPIRVR